jgi:hypothetical protein
MNTNYVIVKIEREFSGAYAHFKELHQCQNVILTTAIERFAAHSLCEKSGFEEVGVKYVMDFT